MFLRFLSDRFRNKDNARNQGKSGSRDNKFDPFRRENFVRTFDHNVLDAELIDEILRAFWRTDKETERQIVYLEPLVRKRNILAPSEVGSIIPLWKLFERASATRERIDKTICLYVQQVVSDYTNQIGGMFPVGVEVRDTDYLICEWNYTSRAWISPFVLKPNASRLLSILVPLSYPEKAMLQFKHFGSVPFKKAGSAVAFPASFTHEFGFINPRSTTERPEPIYCLETHIEFSTF